MEEIKVIQESQYQNNQPLREIKDMPCQTLEPIKGVGLTKANNKLIGVSNYRGIIYSNYKKGIKKIRKKLKDLIKKRPLHNVLWGKLGLDKICQYKSDYLVTKAIYDKYTILRLSLILIICTINIFVVTPTKAEDVESNGKRCKGQFINPITDVCWECLFPITIGGSVASVIWCKIFKLFIDFSIKQLVKEIYQSQNYNCHCQQVVLF